MPKMQDWQVKAIRENIGDLCEATVLNPQVIIETQKFIPISSSEKAAIEDASNSFIAKVKYFEIVMTKENGFDRLIMALDQAYQTRASRILKDAKAEWERVERLRGPVAAAGHGLSRRHYWRSDAELRNIQRIAEDNDDPLQLTPPAFRTNYFPRTFVEVSSTELDTTLWMSDSAREHVFLFKGIDYADLVRLTGYRVIVDKSGNQLRNLTSRFILLENDAHFDRICGLTTRPVHVIEHRGNRFFWIKSNGGVDVIRQFL